MPTRLLPRPSAFLLVAFLLADGPLASASALWGNLGTPLFPINVETGAAGSALKITGAPSTGFSDLAGDPQSQGALVWGVSGFGTNNLLAAVNPSTMAVQSLVTITSPEQMRSLAIDPSNGDFYAASTTSLYRLFPDTGMATLVGTTLLPVDKALGFDSSGNLYGIANENQLVAVTKTTGQTSLVGTLAVYRMEDIAVRPETGVMYGIGYGPNYSLYQINLTNGALVNLGPSVVRPSGLAFAAVPEPATLTVSVLALVGCRLHRCTRRKTCRVG